MKYIASFLLLTLIMFINLANAEIIKLDSMHEFIKKVEQITKNHDTKDVLIIFDINGTLTIAKDAAIHKKYLKRYHDIYKSIVSNLEKDEKARLQAQITSLPTKLIEESTADAIKKLQSKGIKTIALVAGLTGKIGSDKRLEIIRHNNLLKAGISFAHTFPKYQDLMLEIKLYNNLPVFYKGILNANGGKGKNSKGNVLVAFLKYIAMTPKIIIMIDDKLKNLSDIATHLNKYNSETTFIGFEYQGAKNLKPSHLTSLEFKTFWQELVNNSRM